MTNTIKNNWDELKSKIRQQWAKITDDDLMRAEGNWDEVSATLQKAYSLSKEKAWTEIEEFKKKHITERPTVENDKSNN